MDFLPSLRSPKGDFGQEQGEINYEQGSYPSSLPSTLLHRLATTSLYLPRRFGWFADTL